MSSWVSSWFAKPPPTLAQQLEAFELEAEHADNDHGRAQIYNRAGDLCAQVNRIQHAEQFYGRAIDAFLHAGYFEPAAAMCRKIIRYSPNVVRAHFTLAVLSVGKHNVGDAKTEIEAYVRAAKQSGTEKLAIPRLRMIAEATPEMGVMRLLAQHLEEMGDTIGAKRIGRTADSIARGEGPPEAAAADRWDQLLTAALTNSNDLWKFA